MVFFSAFKFDHSIFRTKASFCSPKKIVNKKSMTWESVPIVHSPVSGSRIAYRRRMNNEEAHVTMVVFITIQTNSHT